jgi:hypothetical protein
MTGLVARTLNHSNMMNLAELDDDDEEDGIPRKGDIT